MNNPYRVKVENRRIVKKGYLCPICGEYRMTKTCDCAEAKPAKKTIDFTPGERARPNEPRDEHIPYKKAKKSKSKDLGSDDE